MLFSSPDYPVFLIAVFFLYALARWGGAPWARVAVMLLLGDLLYVLVGKDPGALWDPVGGVVLGLIAGDDGWGAGTVLRWAAGSGLFAAAIALGRTRGTWIASARGQRWIGIGLAAAVAAIVVAVATASAHGALDAMTAELVAVSHLAVLGVLGVGIGAAWGSTDRVFGRVVMLFVASSLFYHAWAAAMHGAYRYLLFLLLATIVLDYYLGIWIERASTPWRGRALVVVSLCSNLGVLFFFKYADFFTQDVLGLDVPRLDLLLPAGISFHTFQSLSYTIDVHRKKLAATHSVVEFATFVLFFPQLVAGPIVRAQDLLPQLQQPPALELHRATTGLFRIAIGLFKKIALADAFAATLVDRVFEAPQLYSSVEVLCGVYGYALQIYLDFSAYSDIAIGSALVLGFELPENFRTPYRSANLQEFWRRWHISLSTWLRDYLYIPLGGSRGAEWRTYVNLSLTMLLGGLWHGASWTFIVWGALHGFGLAVTRYFQRATTIDAGAARRMVVTCAMIAVAGVAGLRLGLSDAGTWTQLVVAWLVVTPLWAVVTAWLGRDVAVEPAPAEPAVVEGMPFRALFVRGAGDRASAPRPPVVTVELLRIAMCVGAVAFLAALKLADSWTWIPLVVATWGFAIAADVVERGTQDLDARLAAVARRAIAVVLVFHYVCLAWVFFRAQTFDGALAVLRQLGDGATHHANVTSVVTIALVVGFLSHFFADGSFRWLRRRFVALPMPLQGVVLAATALVLRELAQHDTQPFIYFQF